MTGWTLRLRTDAAARWRCWFAPAAGLGVSTGCCQEGHESQESAAAHGSELLPERLLRHAA